MNHERAHDPTQHATSPWKLGLLGGVGALTLAPYLLPLIGIGKADSASGIMHYIGSTFTEGGVGTGLAGALQGGIASIPVVGGALTSATSVTLPGLGFTIASGALVTLAAAATLSIGGMLLANWMERREQPGDFPWSKVIRYTSMATSALIALPSMLSAISVGITFLASLFGPAANSHAAIAMQSSLGATSLHSATGAASGLAALIPHFITCGAAALPVIGSLFIDKSTKPLPHVSAGVHQGALVAQPLRLAAL